MHLNKMLGLLAILMVSFTTVAQAQQWYGGLAFPPALSEEMQTIAALEAVAEKPKVVLASEYEKEKSSSSDVIGEVRIVSMRSRDKDIQGNLLMKQIYLEKPFGDNGFSVYFSGYHDSEFRSGSVGAAKQLGDFQLGFGIGSAWYDNMSHTMLNPWVYYQKENDTALITCEHYSKEATEPWFCKGYVERKFGDFLVGAYGEKGSGIGPMLGYYLMDGVKMWVSVPTWNKPNDGSGFKTFIGLTVEF